MSFYTLVDARVYPLSNAPPTKHWDAVHDNEPLSASEDEGENNEGSEEVAGLDNESEPSGLFVEVKSFNGGKVVCELRLQHRQMTVSDVKDKLLTQLCWKEGSADQMTSSDFKLLCLNREMLDDEVLSSYVPDDYDQVLFYLVLVFRGGGKTKKTTTKTKTDKKKADAYKKALEEFSTEFKKVPTNDLVPLRAG